MSEQIKRLLRSLKICDRSLKYPGLDNKTRKIFKKRRAGILEEIEQLKKKRGVKV